MARAHGRVPALGTCNNAPLYSKPLANGGSHVLFLNNGKREGKWMVTDDKDSVCENTGCLLSTRKASLPDEAGLTWDVTAGDDFGWEHDANIVCSSRPTAGPQQVPVCLQLKWRPPLCLHAPCRPPPQPTPLPASLPPGQPRQRPPGKGHPSSYENGLV